MATLVTLVDNTVPVAADFNGNYTALNTELAAMGADFPATRGLTGVNNAATTTTKYDMNATYIKLRNPTTGITRVVAGTALTNDIAAATTVNGRDQAAAFTTSSWVYMYFTGTGTGAPTTLSSASPTGPTLLGGQTEWAFAGAVYNNSTPRLVAMRMRGAWHYYDAQQAVLTTGAATVETSVSLTTTAPPIADRIQLHGWVRSADATEQHAALRVVTGAANDFFYFRSGPGAVVGQECEGRLWDWQDERGGRRFILRRSW